MRPLRTSEECRAEVRDLIQEAIGELDDGRRERLLQMADFWSELMRNRARESEAGGPSRQACTSGAFAVSWR